MAFKNQEKDLLTHKESCVIHCWKEKLPQKRCIGTSHPSPALSWDNTLSKTGKMTLAPPPQGRNPATNPLCHHSTKKHQDYQSQTLHQGGEMLSLSTLGHLHTVSVKHFSPESVVLLQSCWHKVLPERGAAKVSRQTKIKKNKLYATAHCLQIRARFSEGGLNR